MPRSTESLHRASKRAAGALREDAATPFAIDTAALARLSFFKQGQQLAIPRLPGIPASYSHASRGDVSLLMAADLVHLGLGSLALWHKHHGNSLAFITEALNLWLKEQGADELEDHVNFSFSITDRIEDVNEKDGTIFATIETGDCGYLELGPALGALEREEVGLGAAFYSVLMSAMHEWMNTYNFYDAEMLIDRWKESIEMDMEEGETFEEHCERQDMHLPDIVKGVPDYVRSMPLRESAAVALLKSDAAGPFADWISLVLHARSSKSRFQLKLNEFMYEWEDAPLPSWLIAMNKHDGIVQCFDEESASMHESSRAPACLFRYQAGDRKALRDMLRDIASFVYLNRAVAQIADSTAKWSKKHESPREPRRVA